MRDTSSSEQLLSFALVLVFALTALTVRAQESTSAAPPERALGEVVDVSAGATCLESDRLTLRIARWRERDTVDARIRVHVKGDTTQTNRVTFVVSKEGGASAERTLAEAPTDCDQLHSAVALAVALSIDATLTDPNAQREAALPVPPPTAAAPPPTSVLVPERRAEAKPPPASERDDSHLDLAIFVGPTVHMFRDATLMLAPRLAYAPVEWLSIAAATLITHVSDQPVGDANGHFNATLAAGGVDLCIGAAPAPRLSVYGCAGARVGAIITSGSGFMRNFQGTEPWTALAGSLQVRAWLTQAIAIGAAVSFYGSLAQHVIAVDGTGALMDQSTSLPRVGIGIELGPVFRIF